MNLFINGYLHKKRHVIIMKLTDLLYYVKKRRDYHKYKKE